MTTRYLAIAIMAVSLAAAAAPPQSILGTSQVPDSGLLQKGVYTQETLGDLDGAIQIYRQLTSSAAAPKPLAAQAQYQLVLCMLQKGDRTSAAHEFDLLTRNFPDQRDLIEKARKLILEHRLHRPRRGVMARPAN
jgi:outer membrane protein assembly factor BamD (BamD/ComL family)